VSPEEKAGGRHLGRAAAEGKYIKGVPDEFCQA